MADNIVGIDLGTTNSEVAALVERESRGAGCRWRADHALVCGALS